MGAQPSSPSSRAAGGNGGSLRMLGSSTKAAPFAPASEATDSHSQKWGRSLGSRSARTPRSSSSGDLDLGLCDLEAGSPSSPKTASNKQLLLGGGLGFSEQAAPNQKPQPNSMVRRPSKMSVDSFGSNEDSTSSRIASQAASSRPTSAQSRPTSAQSRLSFRPNSRPASASSRLGAAKPPARDPAFIQAERLAKLSLAKLEDEDFIGGRRAWGGASTPSTASPDNLSRATSSVSSNTSGSRPTTSASSVFSSACSSQGNEPNVKADLQDTKKRAKASAAALLSELKGSAGATAARYSTWPTGCPVRITLAGQASGLGSSFDDGSEPDGLIGTLVRYDRVQNTFDVKLDDESTRTVPAQRVTRARPRDRTNANAGPTNLAVPTVVRPTAGQHQMPNKGYSGASSALMGSMHNPSGQDARPWNMLDSSFHEELPLHSQRHSRPQAMPLQVLESGTPAYSPPRPQTLGHPFGGLDMDGPYDLEHTPPTPSKSDPHVLVADCFGRAHSMS